MKKLILLLLIILFSNKNINGQSIDTANCYKLYIRYKQKQIQAENKFKTTNNPIYQKKIKQWEDSCKKYYELLKPKKDSVLFIPKC